MKTCGIHLSSYSTEIDQLTVQWSVLLSEGKNCIVVCIQPTSSISLACEQALLFGQAKLASRKPPQRRPLAASPLARAFSSGSLSSPK